MPAVNTTSPFTDRLPAADVTISHYGTAWGHGLEDSSPFHSCLEPDVSLQEKKVTDEQSEPYVKDIAAPALTHEDSNLEIQSEDSADFLDCKCLDSSPSVNSLKYSFPPYDSSSFDVSTSDKSLEPEAHQQNLPSDEDVHKLNANTVADVKVRGHRLSGSKETMAENSAHGAESKTKLLALLVTNKSTELQQEDSTAHTLLSLAAPIAKLDSTEFESEQVNTVFSFNLFCYSFSLSLGHLFSCSLISSQ